ncbi:MAG TPA: glutathione peroxidase [Planctomycetaceae bacterium]|jgi:glutathione peroxidase|nr:glutathione peroxidase [Planctomycetaceae bacterium]
MMSRLLFAAVCVLLVPAYAASAIAAENSKDVPPVLQFKTKSLDGKDVDLAQYKGKVLLIVNTASHCGFTKQYQGLEALHEKYSKDGLAVLGFPCNQFGKQEPGTPQQIQDFCTSKYKVAFDLFEKIEVNGKERAPLYKWLTSEEATPADPGPVAWNFEKFLVGRDGKVIARFRSPVRPSDPKVVEAIEAALKR